MKRFFLKLDVAKIIFGGVSQLGSSNFLADKTSRISNWPQGAPGYQLILLWLSTLFVFIGATEAIASLLIVRRLLLVIFLSLENLFVLTTVSFEILEHEYL